MASIGNIDAFGSEAQSNASGSVGDNSQYTDNSVQLDLGGATIDTSTNIGLMGEDLQAVGNVINNAIGGIVGVTSQNASLVEAIKNGNGAANITEFLQANKTLLLWGVAGILLLINFNKIKRILR